MSKKKSRLSVCALPGEKSKKRKPTAIERMAAATANCISEINTKKLSKQLREMGEDSDTDYSVYDPSYRSPLEAIEQDIAAFERLYDKGIRTWKLVGHRYELPLQIAVGKRGMSEKLLLSNKIIRKMAAKILIKRVRQYWKETRRTPNRTWWFVTFIGDCGNALEYAPVVNIRAFHGKVYKLLRKAKLDAICAIEVQALTNFPQGGQGGTFMFHAHAIAWSDDPDFDAIDVERQLCGSGQLQHWLGAKTVTVEAIPNEHKHLTWRAYYLLKAPFMGKFVRRSQDTPSGYELAKYPIRSDMAVRLTECLTQLEFPDMVFGVKGGTKISRPWRRDLKNWHKKYTTMGRRLGRAFNMHNLWMSLRREKGDSLRQPFHFIEKGPSPSPSTWETEARLWLLKTPATRRWDKRADR